MSKIPAQLTVNLDNFETLNSWNLVYLKFDPVAFQLFGFSVHWYGIAYVMAIFITFYMAMYFVRKDRERFPIQKNTLEILFLYAEIGVILGARLGYILIYDPNTSYYLTHPWQIFNPLDSEGNFVGIRGMSYHGAIVGFLLSSLLFSRKYHLSFLIILDLIAISLPFGYIFGRIGNFLNQELFGRIIEPDNLWAPIGILVDSTLRYPSQLIEAFLEGFIVFLCLLYIKSKSQKNGVLVASYGILYSLARFVSEYFRQPDAQMGTYFLGFSMGQFLSFLMLALSGIIFIFIYAKKEH